MINQSNPDHLETQTNILTPLVPEVSELIIDDSDEAVVETDVVSESTETTTIPSVESATPVRKAQNVTLEFDINMPAGYITDDVVVLPANHDKETRDALQKMPNVSLLDNAESRKWADDITEGLGLNTYDEMFVQTLEDPEADFRHRIEDGGMSLIGAVPKFKSVQNQTLKGERAVMRLVSHLGLGTIFQTPCWHSGLWVTFKPPSESEIIELNRVLHADKIRLGRYSYGLAFSNLSCFTTDRIVDFALAHVYDLSAKAEDVTVENLKQHLSSLDIPSFIWGFVCTMYPRGFKYRRACVTDPEKCNYVLEELLNISKLQWTNVAALTDWQKTFMAGRQGKTKGIADITRYKEELVKLKNKRLVINEGLNNEVTINIKAPNVAEYIESGHRWIDDIVNIVDKTVGMNTTDQERNNYINRHGSASAMRQYTHWVQSIEYDTNVIDDQETVEKTLDILSSDDQIRSEFIKGVTDYINHSTISVIGIPVYDCPSCNKPQEVNDPLPSYKNIIPLDMIQLFFALLSGKIQNLTNR